MTSSSRAKWVRPPRQLPYCGRDNPRQNAKLPLGDFVAQPVASTAYGRGLDVYVHVTGEAEAAKGYFAFGARIELDGTVTWFRQRLRHKVEHERAEEILEAALGLARAWFERAPSSCAFYYRSLAWEEVRRWRGEQYGEERCRDYLAKLHRDPGAPRTRRVQDEEGKYVDIPVTEEERAASRAHWVRRRQVAINLLAGKYSDTDPRITQLRCIMKKCDAFIKGQIATLLPFDAA